MIAITIQTAVATDIRHHRVVALFHETIPDIGWEQRTDNSCALDRRLRDLLLTHRNEFVVSNKDQCGKDENPCRKNGVVDWSIRQVVTVDEQAAGIGRYRV